MQILQAALPCISRYPLKAPLPSTLPTIHDEQWQGKSKTQSYCLIPMSVRGRSWDGRYPQTKDIILEANVRRDLRINIFLWILVYWRRTPGLFRQKFELVCSPVWMHLGIIWFWCVGFVLVWFFMFSVSYTSKLTVAVGVCLFLSPLPRQSRQNRWTLPSSTCSSWRNL